MRKYVILSIGLSSILLSCVSYVSAATITSRITIPLASNASLVIDTKNGSESQTAVISDSLASTKVILSSDDEMITAPQYYPYGNSITQTSQNPNNRYYTGQRKVDQDDKLYNYNARYYSPETGVFTQPDSVEGPNRFAYVGGNPIMNSDPSGHMSTGSEAYGGAPVGLSLMTNTHANTLPLPGDPTAYEGAIWHNERNAANKDMLAFALGAPIGAVAGYYGSAAALAVGTACMGNMPACQGAIANTFLESTGATSVGGLIGGHVNVSDDVVRLLNSRGPITRELSIKSLNMLPKGANVVMNDALLRESVLARAWPAINKIELTNGMWTQAVRHEVEHILREDGAGNINFAISANPAFSASTAHLFKSLQYALSEIRAEDQAARELVRYVNAHWASMSPHQQAHYAGMIDLSRRYIDDWILGAKYAHEELINNNIPKEVIRQYTDVNGIPDFFLNQVQH